MLYKISIDLNFLDYKRQPYKNFKLIVKDPGLHSKNLDILEHPKRAVQQLFILEYRGYIHAVPLVIDNENNIIIKTVFPNRNFHKIYREKLY